jgi:hypothetical protein
MRKDPFQSVMSNVALVMRLTLAQNESFGASIAVSTQHKHRAFAVPAIRDARIGRSTQGHVDSNSR